MMRSAALCSLFRFCDQKQEHESKTTLLADIKDPPNENENVDDIRNRKLYAPTPKYKTVSRRSCPLLKFLWDRDWPNVIQRVRSHPAEAYCLTENSGRSALHLASFNHGCPLYAAKALLDANPYALWIKDHSNLTPLHYACNFKGGTDHLVPLFCRKLEELGDIFEGPGPVLTSSTSTPTQSPLLLACRRNAPISVLRALLSTSEGSESNRWIAPETGGEPYWYKTRLPGSRELCPLAALSSHLDLEKALQMDYQFLREIFELPISIPSHDFDQEESHEIPAMLRKMMLLVESRFGGYSYSGSVLHMVCSLKVSMPSLVKTVGAILSEQATRRDSLGCIPLHHVLQHPYAPLQLIEDVVAIERDACSICTPDDDTYPLMLAIKRGWEWEKCVAALVRANPETLYVADSSTGFVPFLLAASVDSDITTIFELLRAAPHLSYA